MRLRRLLDPIRALLPASRLVPLSLFAGGALSLGLGASIASAVPAPPSDTMPIGQVKAGMKGHGLTVFAGTTPERFDIEVISTLRNFRANQDLILVKTPHPRLEVTHTVAGMSGSPIYVDGKMIGAYAYGWTFGSEAIAGVTPIQSMLDELARPLPKVLAPRGLGGPLPSAHEDAQPSKPQRPARTWNGAPGGYDLREHASALAAASIPALAAPDGTTLARASTPVMLGGMGSSALKLAGDLLGPMGLEPMQAGGSSAAKPDASAPTKFVDGGAIGVELVRGDVSAMGLGTVTRVQGDKLVAFGHPMLNGGIESLPTAIGKVHWIVASSNRSFKIGEAVRSMGALVNDRQAAIVVDSSVKAPVFPMRVDVEGVDGAPHPTWNVEVAHDQFMAPAFVAMAMGSAVEATTAERRDMTWRSVSRVKLGKFGSISLVDFGSGSGNPLSSEDFARGRLVRALGALLSNPWEEVAIERIDTTIKVDFKQDVSTLRGVKVLETEIDAGQPARIELRMQSYRGGLETKIIEIPVPADMAGHEVEIDLAPGYEVNRPLATPDSLAELVAVLPQQTFDPESIVATFRLRENGAAFHGKIATRLPPGAFDTLRSSNQSDAPETFASQVQTPIGLKRFLVGKDSVHLEVRPVLR